MYKESQFFSLFDKESWNEGCYHNVTYKDGVEICKDKLYEIKESINLNKFSSTFKVVDFFPVDDGEIYYIDENNKLWEYNSFENTFKELYYIEVKGQLMQFKILDEKIFTITKEEDKYYIKKIIIQTGQIINYKVLQGHIQGITMNNKGIVYAIIDGRIIKIDHNGTETELLSKGMKSILNENFKIKVYKESLMALYELNEETLYIIALNKKGIPILLKSKIKSLKCMCFNEKKDLMINSEIMGEWKLWMLKAPKYKGKTILPNFNGEVESIRRHSNSDLYIKSKYNIQYVFEKKHAVSMKMDNMNYKGVYYSKIFDSQQFEMKWHKFIINGNIPKDTQIKIKYYIFDNLKAYYRNGWVNINEILDDNKTGFSEKEKFFENLWEKEIINPREALIQKGSGRYLLFRLELHGRKDKTPKVDKIKVFYNRSSYLRYLPEIYQANLENNDFLDRFLCIFESFYMEIEEKIDYVSKYFDIDVAPLQFLQWMCKWIGMDVYSHWEETKLRRLLKRSAYLHRGKGTRACLEEIIQIYLGYKPIIIENFELKEVKTKKETNVLVKRLYGNNPYSFTMLLQEGDAISNEDYEEVQNILKNEAPAYCEYNVIILKSWILLDNYSYLGINSNIYGYTQLKLDGRGVIPYNSLLLDTVRERVLSGVTRIEVSTRLN